MIFYYYCSYKGSPVGFRIGSIEYRSQDHGVGSLEDAAIDVFIRKCMERGEVLSAFGVMPSEYESKQSFFLLKKKMKASRDEIDFYLNIAIVSEDWNEFNLLMKEGMSKEKISTDILNTIQIEKSNGFGYCLDKEKLSVVADDSFGSVCGGTENRLAKMRQNCQIFFDFASSDTDLNDFQDAIDLRREGMQLKQVGEGTGRLFCYGKKGSAHSIRKILLWAIIVIISGLLIFLLTLFLMMPIARM